jgi:hypothetical protein
VRPFTEVIGDIAGGKVAADLSEVIAEVTKAVEETGKAGSLTLKIKIDPNGDAMVTYEAEIISKVPRPSYGKTMFFTDYEGGVHRRDPRQTELPLRSIHPIHEKA